MDQTKLICGPDVAMNHMRLSEIPQFQQPHSQIDVQLLIRRDSVCGWCERMEEAGTHGN